MKQGNQNHTSNRNERLKTCRHFVWFVLPLKYYRLNVQDKMAGLGNLVAACLIGI